MSELIINGRRISSHHPPLVIAEIGINHGGDYGTAVEMVDAAADAGCECVKFQCHVIEDEMIPNDVVPGNAQESIWNIMQRCSLTEEEDRALMEYVESRDMIYLSTPFSRAAAARLESMGVHTYKIGSGECNNYPLIRYIASFGKPVILSTGMNDFTSIDPAVRILREFNIAYALLHCTSMYPTPYDQVQLGALDDLRSRYPDAVIGLSDHSLGIYTSIGAVALGASILEKHFTSDKSLPGPDVPISIDGGELTQLQEGSRAVHTALGGAKRILEGEEPTIAFAYASVVAIRDIPAGEELTMDNIWVKRPGTGEIKAEDFENVLGCRTRHALRVNDQLTWEDIYE